MKSEPVFPEHGWAILFYRLQDRKGQSSDLSTATITTRIGAADWEKYTVEGKLSRQTTILQIGGYAWGGGQYAFDDFKLEVEVAPDSWEEIPIENSGFENWTDGRPAGWQGTAFEYENIIVQAVESVSAQSHYAMQVRFSDYDVLEKRDIEDTFLPAQFRHITQDEGLPSSYVTCLLQSRQGFIWIGTYSGLVRYDGYDYKIYRHIPADSSSISANDISALYEDQAGGLWVGTVSGGLNYYDPTTETFRSFQHDPDNEQSLSHNTVRAIHLDQEGYLWVGGRYANGLNRLDPRTGQCKRYMPGLDRVDQLQAKWVTSISEDKAGRIWMGTYGYGLVYLDRSTEQFYHYFTSKDHIHQYGTQYILNIYAHPDGTLWLASENGLYHFDPHQRIFLEAYRRPISDHPGRQLNTFWDISLDKHGQLWLAWTNGVSCFDPQKKEFNSFWMLDRNPGSIIVDREGMIWVGSDRGISQINPHKDKFRDKTIAGILPDQLNKLEINGPLWEDSRHNLWVTTTEGLYQIDLKTGEYQITTRFEGPQGPIPLTVNRTIKHIFEDSRQNLWISLGVNGLQKRDPQKGWTDHISTRGNDNVKEIHNIFEDRYGTLWLSAWLGLWQLDQQEKDYIYIPWRSKDGQGRKWTHVSCVYETADGRLWVGTTYGELKYFNRKTGLLHDHTPEYVDTELEYGKNSITTIRDDDKGRLWVGTLNNGFYRIDPDMHEPKVYTEQQGLIHDSVKDIFVDGQGRLWIITAAGLSCFDPRTGGFRNFDKEDGLPTTELSYAHQSEVSGMIYIGTNKGLIYFHPDSIKINRTPPPVVFTNIATYHPGEEGSFRELAGVTEKEEMVISYKNNIITLTFAALSYSKTAKNEYEYRLEGQCDKWVTLGDKRDITLSNLPAGQYTLEVKGTNGDGVWSEEPATLQLIVRPPWYWSPWAKIGYVLLAFGLLLGVRLHERGNQRVLLAMEQERNDALVRMDQLKDQFLANTSHELRTPLQGIVGLSESLIEQVEVSEQKEDLAMIISSGRRLSNLVNDILDFSKIKNNDIHLYPHAVDLRTLVSIVMKYNAPLIKGKDIQLINNIPPDLPPVRADENRLQQILYTLIGNAIKFTETGHVKIGIAGNQLRPQMPADCENLQHIIYVQDTGTGIPMNKQESIFQAFEQGDGSMERQFSGAGLGLSVAQRLVEMHGGLMWVESEIDRGSTFFFTLPMTHEQAQPISLGEEHARISEVAPHAKIFSGLSSDPLENLVTTYSENNDTIHILVVDDEPINQKVLHNHLSTENYKISQAMNGEEALRALDDPNHQYSLVILDVMMPKMSGYEVCQRLRKKYLPSELPVIMVTAKNQVQDLVQGLAVGANDYLAKPFSKEEFLARVKTQLDLHRIFDVAARFIPNEFIRALGRERITDILYGDHTEKEVTILFVDIRDYTTLAEDMTPTENYNFVNAFNKRVGPVVRKHRGFVNQYLGDGFMAIFQGRPEDALRAAVEIQQKINQYNEERALRERLPIQLGIGFHTGPLVMGIIGDQKRMEAAIISDTVNTASRIEGLTKYYGGNIMLSEDVLLNVNKPSAYRLRYLGKVRVKGRKEPLGIYECFDGDPPEILQKKEESLPHFEHAMKLYFSRNFVKAVLMFQRVLQINPQDQAAKLLMNKAAGYASNGPANWSGVEEMSMK